MGEGGGVPSCQRPPSMSFHPYRHAATSSRITALRWFSAIHLSGFGTEPDMPSVSHGSLSLPLSLIYYTPLSPALSLCLMVPRAYSQHPRNRRPYFWSSAGTGTPLSGRYLAHSGPLGEEPGPGTGNPDPSGSRNAALRSHRLPTLLPLHRRPEPRLRFPQVDLGRDSRTQRKGTPSASRRDLQLFTTLAVFRHWPPVTGALTTLRLLPAERRRALRNPSARPPPVAGERGKNQCRIDLV